MPTATAPERQAWEQLYSLQQEYEGLCRKAWSLRREADPLRCDELDREVSAVLRRVEAVFEQEPVRSLYA